MGRLAIALRIATVSTMVVLSACQDTEPRRAPGAQPALDQLPPEARQQVQQAWTQAHDRPGDAAANGQLGMMLLAYERYTEAAAYLQATSELQPANFAWPYYLGQAQLKSGHAADALATLKQALRLKPNFVPLEVKLAEALLAAGNAADAERAYRAIVMEHGASATAHRALAAFLEQQGKSAEAQAEITTADNLGQSAEDKDPWMDAVQQFRLDKQVPAAKPPDPRLEHFDNAKAFMAKLQYAKAIEELKQTLQPEDGNTPGYLYALSIACSRAGDSAAALKYGYEAQRQAVLLHQDTLAKTLDSHLQLLESGGTP